jgi:hypothetical protein
MSNISSNCLFHFTSNAEHLIGILTNNFVPRYCYEETILNLNLERGKIIGAIPMVCFCDISLSQISNHVETYGSYGIGMTKEWGIKNKLNPIIYINENSKLANAFSGISNNIFNLLNNSCNQDSTEACDEFLKIAKFIKPYKGNFLRKNNIISNVKFYNEKEWRYIPTITNNKLYFDLLSKEEYEDTLFLAKENEKMNHFKLTFTPKDIKYIFVSNEDEIHTMVQALRDIKGPKFSQKEIDILTTKIITTKQILEDF